MRTFGRAGLSACLVIGVAACERSEPTGLPANAANPSSALAGAVYAEERPFWNLAHTVPGSAGFFLDTASGNVIVSLTDMRQPQAAPRALRTRLAGELAKARARHPSADIVSRQVTYTFLQLKQWRDALNGEVFAIPGVVWLDLDEVRNRVVIGLEAGTDAAPLRRLAGEFAVPDGALYFEIDAPAVPEARLTDQIRPIAGATRIQSLQAGSTVTCTMGFPALWNGTKAFVTASHCSRSTFAVDGTQQYQPTVPLTHADSLTMAPIGFEVADYSEACPPKLGSACAWADAAIYQFGGAVAQWAAAHIARPTYGCFPGPCNPVNLQIGGYLSIASTDSSLVVGDLVNMIGSATGWNQSYLQKSCVNVKLGPGVAECQDYGNYGNGAGDSGAPVLLNITTSDSNAVLGGIHWGKTGQYAVFSPWSGIAREYANLSVVRSAGPPSWPLLTNTFPQLDTSRLVSLPSGRYLYRANITLRFLDAVADTSKVAFFSRHGMTVVGVTRSGRFFVGIPDPGPPVDSLFAVLQRLNDESEILDAATLDFSAPQQSVDYRYPTDGPGQARSDWTSSATSTWAMRAIRAPLAWGCETGAYGDALPAVGIFEWKHQSSHPEFAASSPTLWEPPDAPLSHIPPASPAVVDSMERHAVATTGLLAAQGNNGSGIAGVNWRTGLHLYAGYTSPGNHALPIIDNFFVLAEQMVQDQLRVLSLSADAVVDSTRPVADRDHEIHLLAADIQHDLLDRLPALLVVVAAGNERYRGTAGAYLQNNKAAVIRAALLLLRSDTAYQDRILVLTGTIPNNRFWDTWSANPNQGSNFFSGITDIAAPAQDVTVLDRWTGQTGSAVPLRVATGTSLSAPLAAGAAGLLLAHDPTLTAAQVKDFILRGARQPRPDPQSWQIAPPPPVTGAPETVYQLDAYGALNLVAQRPGVPLCGNRVWAANNLLLAERDPVAHTTETLVTLGEAGPGVNVYHGARRIEVTTALGDRDRAFALQQGQWVETTDTATTPPGGTFFSMLARSHDWDSTASERTLATSGPAAFEINVYEFATTTQTTIDTLVFSTSERSGSECIVQNVRGECVLSFPTSGTTELLSAGVAFPSVGGRLLVAVSHDGTQTTAIGGWQGCPNADTTFTSCRSVSEEEQIDRAELWAVDLQTRQATHLWTFPNGGVYWFGVSEDGSQVVSGEGALTIAWTSVPNGTKTWTDPGTIRGCAIRYRSIADGTEVAPAVFTADACAAGALGHGTVAPTPRRSSSP